MKSSRIHTLALAILVLVSGGTFIPGICQGTVIPAETIENKVKDYILSIARGKNLDIKVEVPRACDLPVDGVENPVLSVSHDTGDRIRQHIPVTVTVQDKSGAIVKKFKLVARLRIFAEAVVVSADIPSGESIEDDNVTMKKVEIPFDASFYPSFNDVKGMKAKKRLRAGTVLTPLHLRLEYLVSRGEEIDVEIHDGDVSLRVRGIARENGGMGDQVRIYIPMTKKILMGVVTGAKAVESGT